MRETGIICSQAVLLAIGIGVDGRRSILAVELANRESHSSWKDFLLGLRERRLSDVEFVVSRDRHDVRRRADLARRPPFLRNEGPSTADEGAGTRGW